MTKVKKLLLTIAVVLISLAANAQEIRNWEYTINAEEHNGFRVNGMQTDDGIPALYFTELHRGRDQRNQQKHILCQKKFTLQDNPEENPTFVAWYCFGQTNGISRHDKTNDTWHPLPALITQQQYAAQMPQYARGPENNHIVTSLFETVNMRSESIIYKVTQNITYNQNSTAMEEVAAKDTTRVSVALPDFNGRLRSTGSYLYAEEDQSLLLVNGIHENTRSFDYMHKYAFIVIDTHGNVKGSSRIDLEHRKQIIAINKVFDYSSASQEREFKGYVVSFCEAFVMPKKERGPHRSQIDIVFINADGTMGFHNKFNLTDDPLATGYLSAPRVAMVSDKLYLTGKATVGRNAHMVIKAMDQTGTVSGGLISAEKFYEVTSSERDAHKARAGSMPGSLKEHGTLSFTISNEFLMSGALNLDDKGIILYGQTYRTPGASTSNAGYGDMIALHVTPDGKLIHAWFGNIAHESKRKNTPNDITPYRVAENKIVFVSRREVQQAIPAKIRNVMMKQHYTPLVDIATPQIPVLVTIDLDNNTVVNLEPTADFFIPYPVSNYHWQNPADKAVYIIGHRHIVQPRADDTTTLLITEYRFR